MVSKNVTVTRLYNRDNRKIHVGLGIIRLRRTVTSSHGVARRELHCASPCQPWRCADERRWASTMVDTHVDTNVGGCVPSARVVYVLCC